MLRLLFVSCFLFSNAFAYNINNTESYVISNESALDKTTSIEIQKIVGKENIKTLNSSDKIVEISDEKKEKIDQILNAIPENIIEINKLKNDYRELTSRAPLLSQESQEKQQLLNIIQNEKTTEKVELINVAPPTILNHAITSGYDNRDGFDKPGSFIITIEGANVNVTRKSIETTENGYIWKGDIEDGNGSALIIYENNKLSGTIHYKENIYSLTSLNDSSLHALIKKNFKDIKEEPNNHENTRDSTYFSKKETPQDTDVNITIDSEDKDNTDYTEITIVVAYTKQAEAKSPNISSVIRQAIANTNDSFKRSKLNFINIVPVAIYREEDDEPQNWNDILKAFYNPNDNIINKIYEVRKQNKANLSILIAGNNTYCGEAKVIAAKQPEDTFAIVSHECAADYYSFAHEIGHLIGARHEYCSDDKMEPYPFGHGYLSKTLGWRTIMSYASCCQGNNCVRIRNWANPYVKYKGEKTGNLTTDYDAKVWRIRATEISKMF